ncbi:MAG TPA: hypothetical protein VH092_04840 [Urbifossiella sp.]|jgi:hypothetical protein|nr:hypothetical protein [Urbifossiella sp.]
MRPVSALFLLTLGLTLAADPAAAVQPKAVTIKLNKLSAPAPAGWVNEKPKYTLRSYQFQLPAAEKDGHAGEFIVMPESDPKADKVFPRWKVQFLPPDGKTVDDISKVSKLDLKGTTVDLLDVTGTWKYRERPFDPKSKEELREDYRVVWAVVGEKDEASHIRLSGPKELVDKNYPAFEAWLKALK